MLDMITFTTGNTFFYGINYWSWQSPIYPESHVSVKAEGVQGYRQNENNININKILLAQILSELFLLASCQLMFLVSSSGEMMTSTLWTILSVFLPTAREHWYIPASWWVTGARLRTLTPSDTVTLVFRTNLMSMFVPWGWEISNWG